MSAKATASSLSVTYDDVGSDTLSPSTRAAARGEVEAGSDTLDHATELLIQLAAQLAGGSETGVHAALQHAFTGVNPVWVEELILQTYLFAGFPRALNGAREWRSISGRTAPPHDEGERFDAVAWQERGEATCRTVYGRWYEGLRHNVRGLHPALDAWMIVEGYGKVLSRPGLALWRRELCVVAACAIGRQDRQLQSHLHGALHAGASSLQVQAALDVVAADLPADDAARYNALFSRVAGK